MINQLSSYLLISEYLRKISINEYTKGKSVHDNEINDFLMKIKKYEFTYKNNGDVYDLKYKEMRK
jgi:hypothetical protein